MTQRNLGGILCYFPGAFGFSCIHAGFTIRIFSPGKNSLPFSLHREFAQFQSPKKMPGQFDRAPWFLPPTDY